MEEIFKISEKIPRMKRIVSFFRTFCTGTEFYLINVFKVLF